MKFQFVAICSSFLSVISSAAASAASTNLRHPPQQHDANTNHHRSLSTTTTITYPPPSSTNANIPTNPERGFYTQHTYFASSPRTLDAASLIANREGSGETLILRLYYLDSFVDGSSISDGVLNDLRGDFEAMKSAG